MAQPLTAFRRLAARFDVAISLGPVLAIGLLAALHGDATVGNLAVNPRAGADIGAAADLDRRHQRGVGADERAGADLGLVLCEAIIVAGDSARADIGVDADMGIADIAEMVDLDAGLKRRRLGLDEIADPCAIAERSPRPQARKGANRGILSDR